MNPELTFFCELKAEALQELFEEESVIDDLVILKASVSMGILDFSHERVEVIRRLNHAAVPVVAWLLLPKEEGYYFNIKNAVQAKDRYEQFKIWTQKHKLKWCRLGMDHEPDYNEMEGLIQGRKGMVFPIVKRLLDMRGLHHAHVEYWNLVSQMRADGYRVDSYHFPFIIDERRAGSTLIQRLAGLVDAPSDREVLMLYTSMFRPHGPGMLWSYAKDAESVGVGSTGGGVQLIGMSDIPPLDWVELSRDLRLARRWTDDIHIFSLEGCVQQGFMDRLKDLDWDGPVTLPLDAARKVHLLRIGLQGSLWSSAHPLLALLVLFLTGKLFSRIFRRGR